ncbi:hypothetical protein [Phyllobacterium sp. 628]|uniref:hypothetical protein n=1 Tax=Phyllobacterium sp. 628 TaxID=2718938 RepID=UPI001FCEFD47|nr:hypothetical protein [Phyllobacterium sp. 628]
METRTHLPMNNAAASRASDFTLADFLSTYRYWALFFASLFAAVGSGGLITFLPLISQTAGNTTQTLAVFYLGSTLGWVVAAFLAFIVAARNGRAALVSPIVVCGIVAVGFLAMPGALGYSPFLFLFGLAAGTVRAVFPLAIAIFLVSGRPDKIDFACALTLLSTTILISALAPAGAAMLFALDQSGSSVIWGFLACLFLAILVLLPARRLDFDETPRQRHKPLPQIQRSPILVCIILLGLPIVLLLTGLSANFFQVNAFKNPIFVVPPARHCRGCFYLFCLLGLSYPWRIGGCGSLTTTAHASCCHPHRDHGAARIANPGDDPWRSS